ncbi:uncharacterized protein A4U43_C04F8020 [Asparagus officinalis]|uniref:DUF1771 domain-containing protein n=1 Tax=Asparagus officinalis TaxID=4686 RepID=A0A5P1F1V0_ASPOF|nr:putative nuclear RNA export factor SDE5 [Asparagus officinalis]XP_020260481.1 putative nuclear RNA export factor SDE5 [Asparagus officinalis]XP_020260482.1 putative nuclear RNA export factor SDE5 [Asparagus officinalis]XP_020260483.1 putative nuclear RNA export factor SDE5 [Asparagus officinalis]XP_020260484.1 putative nuclear RNA export factor SDE5 [Asparagus officinalis]ONK71387.1 uncharacterized protein A4U43_C04F8020 [Asparagus officinalis]
MEPYCSLNIKPEDETKALGYLLDVYHPFFSLQEIASAYCKAGSDLCKAGELLCQLQKSNSDIALPEIDNGKNTMQLQESATEDKANHFCNITVSKPKKLTAAVGTVSTILGKSYARPASSKREVVEATKPSKSEVKVSSPDELEKEAVNPENHLNHKDIEELLFSMLGDGFKLSMDVIREVLGQCGYDVKKSMNELLGLSAKAQDKGKGIAYDISEKCIGADPKSELWHPKESHEKLPSIRKATEPTSLNKERSDLPRELLLSLFSPPDRFEEEEPKKRLEWGLNRTRVIGQKVVTKPYDDIISKPVSDPANAQPENDHVVEEEDIYGMLRQDAKKHWDKMKELYEAAIEAYGSGDRSKANDLIEQGRRHKQMAREADEKCAVEILETKKSETRNDVPLDLRIHSARDSIRLLKKHLVSLANIPIFRYLKVIVNTDDEDTTKGKRKRQVIKLLERESIKWTEEDGNPGTILILLNEVDPSNLTFADNQQ